MSSDIISRVGAVLVEALQRARSVMAQHGHAADVRDSIDVAAGLAIFEVVVGDVVVYRIVLDFSDVEASAVVGRWIPESLHAIGLSPVAEKVSAIAARRAS